MIEPTTIHKQYVPYLYSSVPGVGLRIEVSLTSVKTLRDCALSCLNSNCIMLSWNETMNVCDLWRGRMVFRLPISSMTPAPHDPEILVHDIMIKKSEGRFIATTVNQGKSTVVF